MQARTPFIVYTRTGPRASEKTEPESQKVIGAVTWGFNLTLPKTLEEVAYDRD